MRIIDDAEIQIAILKLGVQREGKFFNDRDYLVPSKKWLLDQKIPNLVQEFQEQLWASYVKQSSDCDDMVAMAKLRVAMQAATSCEAAELFFRRSNAETQGNKRKLAVSVGHWYYDPAPGPA
jgi:hypothetical protein